MFLIAMIFLLALMIVSTLKIVERNKTGDLDWGEPFVTIAQIILMVIAVALVAMD